MNSALNQSARVQCRNMALGLLMFIVCLAQAAGAFAETNSFRIGFTTGMFWNVNENDARAAVKVWGQTVARQNGIDSDPQTQIFRSAAAAVPVLKTGQVDAIGMSILEYLELSNAGVQFDPIFVTYVGGQPTEQYILAVRADERFKTVSDLHGHNILIYQDARSCLAVPWLEALLRQNNEPSSADFFGQVGKPLTLSKTVLPVFFHQADACLVTRSGFATMVELNPQLGKQLRILARSDEVVPAVFAFRAAYNPPFKSKLMKGLADLNESATGQQILTLFHCERIAIRPEEFLRPTIQFVAGHTSVSPATNSGPLPPTSVASKQQNGGGR